MDASLIIKDIQAKKFASLYFLHGEETYYIDLISDALQKNVLEEHERDFNQTMLYGKDADSLALQSELKAYPMMAERRLVILKEAQDFKHIDALEAYAEAPSPTTIFVVCYKHKTFDARKKLLKHFAKNGLIFKSDKIRDYQLPDWIAKYVRGLGMQINGKATMLLAEFLGADLGRIANEIEKLRIVLGANTAITEQHIEQHIGISKDYNIFELVNAIAQKQADKAFKIVQYFEYNPKAGELVVIVPALFKLFSQLMRVHFTPNKSREAIASSVGVHPFVAGELLANRQNYDPKKIAAIIALLHEYDLKAKGVGNSQMNSAELLKELVFQIMYA
ncbi:MAG: DNA polymerase III subunit delta [Crocinitomicaceae bacterium]|nr:DNA polymerase III subunit delta [Crocinitomicaceae bacterium]